MEIAREEQDRVTLRVLRRSDPHVEAVCARVAFVSLYKFDADTSAWEKRDVEGPMFVVSRRHHPHYQMVVMNRVALDNVVESLDVPGFKIKNQEPYLMYRNSSGDIVGMWVHNPAERDLVFQHISAILDRLKQTHAGETPTAAPHPLLRMLHDKTAPAAYPATPPVAPASRSEPQPDRDGGAPEPSSAALPPPHAAPGSMRPGAAILSSLNGGRSPEDAAPAESGAGDGAPVPRTFVASKEHVREVLLLLANDDEALEVLTRALQRRGQ